MKRTPVLVGAAALTLGVTAGVLLAQQQPPAPQPFFVGNRLGLPINPAADGSFEAMSPSRLARVVAPNCERWWALCLWIITPHSRRDNLPKSG